MIFLWVQIVVMIFYGLDMFFLMVLDMIFLMFFLWFFSPQRFSAKNSRNFRFFYDFARVSLGKS